MKMCPSCHKEWDDQWGLCKNCNTTLVAVTSEAEARLIKLEAQTKAILKELEQMRANGSLKATEKDTIAEQKMKPKEESSKQAMPASISTPKRAPSVEDNTSHSLESQIGKVWFNRIGALAIIVGAALFLKYAFDSNWIGAIGRVAIGLLAGISMIVAGEFSYKKNYKIFAEGLIAGGTSILYLSIYAAFGFYKLVGPVPAFAFMMIVTFFSAVFAIRFDSPRVIGLTIAGGFLTPFLISVNTVNPAALFGYLILLDLGILAIGYFKKWEHCNITAVVLTYITYFLWSAKYNDQHFLQAEIFLTSIFVIFSLLAVLYNFINKKLVTPGDIGIIILNGIFYFVANYQLLQHKSIPDDYLSFLAIAMALIYAGFSYNAFRRTQSKEKHLIQSYLSLVLFFATISIPLIFKDYWITIGFIIESSVLGWLGFRTDIKGLRRAGLILSSVAAIKLLLFDFSIFYPVYSGYRPIFNMRLFSYMALTAGALATAFTYKANADKCEADEKGLATFLAISASIILLMSFSLEINSYFAQQIAKIRKTLPVNQYAYRSEKVINLTNIKRFALSAAWMVYSFALIALGMFRKFKALRITALALFAITIFKIFIWDTSMVSHIWRILSFVGLGVILMFTSLLYQKYKDKFVEFVSGQ